MFGENSTGNARDRRREKENEIKMDNVNRILKQKEKKNERTDALNICVKKREALRVPAGRKEQVTLANEKHLLHNSIDELNL
jgi:hypothetical protein